MLDIYDVDKDVTFKDYQFFRIKNLMVTLGSYKYFKDIGINWVGWLQSNIAYDVDTFKSYIIKYLKDYEVQYNAVSVELLESSISSIEITIENTNYGGLNAL